MSFCLSKSCARTSRDLEVTSTDRCRPLQSVDQEQLLRRRQIGKVRARLAATVTLPTHPERKDRGYE